MYDSVNIPNGSADLVFSPIDEEASGAGWYWHAFWNDGKDAVSVKSWASEDEARAAMRAGSVVWL